MQGFFGRKETEEQKALCSFCLTFAPDDFFIGIDSQGLFNEAEEGKDVFLYRPYHVS